MGAVAVYGAEFFGLVALTTPQRANATFADDLDSSTSMPTAAAQAMKALVSSSSSCSARGGRLPTIPGNRSMARTSSVPCLQGICERRRPKISN